MTLVSPVSLRPLDQEACDEIRALVYASKAGEALERLRLYQPRDAEQRVNYHGLRATTEDTLGSFDLALRDWFIALHGTTRARSLRPRVRVCMSETYISLGDHARAERVLQRCVAELRAEGDPDSYESWALGALARIHLARGTLTLALRLYERALALLEAEPPDSFVRSGLQVNYVLTLLRMGDFRRVDEVLSEMESPELSLVESRLAPVLLSRALWGLESGDLEACERALEQADDRTIGDYLRYRQVRLEFQGALELARGRLAKALELCDRALEMSPPQKSTDDMTARLLSLKAAVLVGLDRAPEALTVAQEATLACPGSDLVDQPACLRVQAKCLAALGRDKEARASLATALSLLESTEYVVERRKVSQAMQALGMGVTETRTAALRPSRMNGAKEPTHRFELSNGRTFLTSDAELVDRLRKVAENRLPILLEGETGTGKELVARLLHEMRNAREAPFVVVDCTTLSESLAEAELFGVMRGAYTGAATDRIGLVGAANGGTLLFDELPELSLSAQSKLLRLLQEGTYRRLGDARPRNVRVRVIATTNQDAEQLLAQGRLKPDLFFRLHGYRIRLRPLRERSRDIALLAQEFASAEGLAGISAEALARLTACPWPGNTRQLEMLIRVAASGLEAGSRLEEATVTKLLDEFPGSHGPSPEKMKLQGALDGSAGNVAAAARVLGMSRQGLYKALRRNGLI